MIIREELNMALISEDTANQLYNIDSRLIDIVDFLTREKPFEVILHFKGEIHSVKDTYGYQWNKLFLWNKEHKLLIIKEGDIYSNSIQFLETKETIICKNKNEAVLKAAELFNLIQDPFAENK